MANENKLILVTQQEKPNHYTYLKEFRVEQCQSFLQHKCNQHRPFICFNWHFQNQRRRRPIRKRDGTFNYSADNYCTKYDETTGLCPDGDECPFLHRTAGDTERRYHLRYYKTCMCVHDTDSRGYCVKNGHHCAFAHGALDQRPPVYDVKEVDSLQNAENPIDGTNSQNALDKERNLMNEDPQWQDTNYVLANYKTEPCKRPPRLCRQGYACPQYHNSKDKRRSPRKFKYRSTPCPNVKHGEEWGEPGNCEAGDNCQYCHTRTEQQFHPEIYKSTKCNDVQQAGYCPRSVFCAFAHVEPFIFTEDKPRDLDGPSPNLALSDLISSALPDMKKDPTAQGLMMAVIDNLMGIESDSNSIISALEKSQGKFLNFTLPLERLSSCSIDDMRDMVPNQRDNPISAGLAQSGLLQRSSAPINIPNSQLTNSITDFNSGGFSVNIPSSALNFSPTNHSNLFSVSEAFNYSGSNSKHSNSISANQNDGNIFFPSRIISPGFADKLSISPSVRISEMNSLRDDINNSLVGNSLFDNSLQSNKQAFSLQSLQNQSNHLDESRFSNELITEISDLKRKLELAQTQISLLEIQRDKALEALEAQSGNIRSINWTTYINSLSPKEFQQFQEECEKGLYQRNATKCMKCEENKRTVTLDPCNHFVLCDSCACSVTECPYCQTPISSQA